MTALVDVLRTVPFLADVSGPALERLAARCVPRTVGAGFTLFRAGEPCGGVYVVLEGQVRVYRTAHDGREQTLTVEGPGRPVAELPLFDGGPYPASAVTEVASRLAFLPRTEFEYAFRHDPDVASAVVAALGRRLRHLVQLVETIAFRDVAARLAMHLADYASRDGRLQGADVVLDLRRTQEDLATEIGTARESVSRAIKQLKKVGLVRGLSGTVWRLAPVGQLRDWARGDGA
ncbi:MAG: Crp/Fnr family transcriptional regulator [Gemmatimonadales bacterium]